MKKNDVLAWLEKGARSRHVDEADQDVLKNVKPRKSLCDPSKRLPDHHDRTAGTEDADHKNGKDRSPAHAIRQGEGGRQGGRERVKPPAYLQNCRRLSEPTLEFKVEKVRVPDLDWLNDTEGFEEPAPARVFRKTPMAKRAPPREPETIQRTSRDA
ncbi:hypothetical protein T484DRAFT_1922481 [Baffinella frigidus]|nr:hypothetical protein T484DRAFT_1922481 [Cryptophyta sp. CCMP2293]